jgi:hypothetical protein
MASRKRLSLVAIAKYTSLQGEVVHAANRLHDDFFETFLIAISLGRAEKPQAMFYFYDHALAIWHVIQSDSSQRQMALQAIATVPTKLNLGTAISRLKWAKSKADALASGRNIIAHNPVNFRPQFDGPKGFRLVAAYGSASTRPAHRQRLDMIRGLGLWRSLRDDMLKLGEYVMGVNDYILTKRFVSWGLNPLPGMPSSLPHRPRLQSVARLQAIDSQLQAATQKTKHRNRKQSFRT